MLDLAGSEQLSTVLAVVKQVGTLLEEDLKFLLVKSGEDDVVRVDYLVKLLDSHLFGDFLRYVALVHMNLLAFCNNSVDVVADEVYAKLNQVGHHQIICGHEDQMQITDFYLWKFQVLILLSDIVYSPPEYGDLALDSNVQIFKILIPRPIFGVLST